MYYISLFRFIESFIKERMNKFRETSKCEKMKVVFEWFLTKLKVLLSKKTAQLLVSMLFFCLADSTIRKYKEVALLKIFVDFWENKLMTFADDVVSPLDGISKLIGKGIALIGLNENFPALSIVAIILIVGIFGTINKIEKNWKNKKLRKLNFNTLEFQSRIVVFLLLFTSFYKREVIAFGIGVTVGIVYFLYTLVEISNEVAEKLIEDMNKKVIEYFEENSSELSKQININIGNWFLLLLSIVLFAISIYLIWRFYFIGTIPFLIVANMAYQLRKLLMSTKYNICR